MAFCSALISRVALTLGVVVWLGVLAVTSPASAHAEAGLDGLVSAAPANDPDLPVWPFAIGAIAAVAVVLYMNQRRRR